MKGDKYLGGSDIFLNLKEICIHNINSYSSSSCSGGASIYFGNTRHGRVEDPDLTGEIKVLTTRKEKGCYVLKVRFKKSSSRD